MKYLAEKFPVVMITGPRQSGKSTLLKRVFPDYAYVNLEDFALREYAMDDPKGFLHDFADRVIIDEIQYAPNLLSYIQIRSDEVGENGMYILTGSQNFQMMQSVSQSLAGRVGILELLPLSLAELERTAYRIDSDNEWIFSGGYPRRIAHNIDEGLFYSSYISTYLERDVRQILNITSLDMFNKFLTLCASRVGQQINYSDISSQLGIDYRTAQKWVSILKASYIIFELQPYHNNFGKRITKTPKLYFYDTGIVCHLLGIDSALEVNSHFLRGHLFENAIIAEFYKRHFNNATNEKFYYWRSGEALEVDLIIESDVQSLYEIKSSRTANGKFTQNLHRYVDFAHNRTNHNAKARVSMEQAHVVYAGSDKLKLNSVRFLPWNRLPEK